MKKYILAILLIALSFTYVAYGSSDLNNKLKDANQNLQGVKSQINNKTNILKELNQTTLELDRQIGESQNKIDSTQKDIQAKQGQIAETQESINEFEASIDKNTDVLSKRLKVMYRSSEIDYIRIILDSEDMEEALSNMTMIKKIVEKDKDTIRQLKEDKEAVEAKKKQLVAEEREMISLKAAMEAQKQVLERTVAQQEKSKEAIRNDLEKLEVMEEEFYKEAVALESQIRQLQQSKGNTGAYKGGSMTWPVASGGRVTSTYSNRINPISKKAEMHTGIDIAAPSGTSILAANDGKVIFAGNRGTYGKAMMVDHGGGIVTLYAHCSGFIASEGQTVSKGQAIAKVGSTGYSTGPHLHFEVRINGKHTNPASYIGL